MADDADRANDATAKELDRGIRAARKSAAEIPAGTPGECGICGRWSERLVRGACAPCRDKEQCKHR